MLTQTEGGMVGVAQPGTFGELLRQHRLEAGLTQAALAEQAGLSVRAVQHLERALGQPQRETTRRLAEALDLTPERRVLFERAAAPLPRRRAAHRRAGALVVTDSADTPTPGSTGLHGELSAERKHITVLSAEVAGLTESAQRFEPDLADRLLSQAVRLLVDVSHRYQGTVNWVRGDGIMVLFGAPLAYEDHAIRACHAALAMHEAFRHYADRIAQQRNVNLALRIGLDCGEVVVRTTSNDLYKEYTAIGPAVRRSTQLQQLAEDSVTLVTGDILRLVEGYFDVRPGSGSRSAGPVDVFELACPTPPLSRFQRVASTRQLTRFVGRETELLSVKLPLDRAQAGNGQIVAVVGEAGVGKSRLVWEVIRSQQAEGWLVLERGAVSYGNATSYLPVIELLKGYCRIGPKDDVATVREKLIGKILTLDRALEPDLAALLALLDVPVDPSAGSGQAAWHALDPPQRRRRTLEAIKRMLLRESMRQPLLLVIEDLHWIDAETQALLDSLVESLAAAPILLLVTYRLEYEHHWTSKSYYTQLRIDGLSVESANELLGALLGDDAGLRPLKQHMVWRTEGNPLFLEESVRTLVEDGALLGERGAYRLARPFDAVRVPATLQTVLAARIDRLEPAVKRLLQSAAVIGKDVPFSILRAIADLPEAELHRALAQLQAAELLYEASFFPELEYTFKHALTHEVAYSSVLHDRRRATHAQVVQAIEQLHADRLVEQVEPLAYHALRGEVWDKALTYARQAGRRVALRSAHREAVNWFNQALLALRQLPETRDSLTQAIEVRLELRSSLYPLGMFEQIIDLLREAESLAEALEDQARLARVSAYLASAFFTTGNYPVAIESAERTLAIAEARSDFGTRILGNHYLGLSYYCQGAYRRAIEHLTRNVALLIRDLTNERFGLHGVAAVFSRTPLVWSLAELGEFAAALERAQEEVQIAEAIDHPYTLAAAYQGAGLLELRRGELNRAIAIAERAVRVCQTWEIRTIYPVVSAQLGYAYALSGRTMEGLVMLAEAVKSAEAIKTAMNSSLSVGWLGEAYLLNGHATEALEQATRALDLARVRGERGASGWALRLRGEVAARRDPADVEQAAALYREALALAKELEMRPLQAHCHLGIGRLYRREGREEAARAELAAAVEHFRSLGMAFWLPEAEQELARIR